MTFKEACGGMRKPALDKPAANADLRSTNKNQKKDKKDGLQKSK